MWDPRLGMRIQGRMRKRGLSMTSGRFFLRSGGVHPMKRSRGARDQAAVLKPEHGEGPAVAVVDGVAHLGADEGLVAEVVVAGDELVPEPALLGAAGDGSELERADLVKGGGRREERRFGLLSEEDGAGSFPLPLRGWQDDEAVAVHGEHGDTRHHVLEPAVGLEPADAPAELPGQGVAVERGRPGDHPAQQSHFPGGEVAPVVAALDGLAHAGAVISRLRPASIDHGSQGDRSPGGPPPRAHAASQPASQRPTSRPLSLRVAVTEYMRAVKAGAGLAVGAEREAPPDGRAPQQPLGEVVVERHPGPVEEDAQPLAVVEEGAQRPSLPRFRRQAGELALCGREQAAERLAQRVVRRLEGRPLALEDGVVEFQPRLVQAVEGGDPPEPLPAPAGQTGVPGRAPDEVPAHVRPAERESLGVVVRALEAFVPLRGVFCLSCPLVD